MANTNEKLLATAALLDAETQKRIGDSVPILGYAANTDGKDTVLLYKDVLTPCDTMEISLKDVTHSLKAPEHVLPYNGIILWVRRDAPITYKRTLSITPDTFIAQKRVGRLVASIGGSRVADDDCTSHCNGDCDSCECHCTKGEILTVF